VEQGRVSPEVKLNGQSKSIRETIKEKLNQIESKEGQKLQKEKREKKETML